MRFARMIGMGAALAGGWFAIAGNPSWAAPYYHNVDAWQGDVPAADAAGQIAVPSPRRAMLTPLLVADPVGDQLPPPAPAIRPKPPVRTPAPGRATVTVPTENAPTGAEIVAKSLSKGASDPNIPLPHPNLAEMSAESAASNGTRLYGRAEPGEGVLDFRGGMLGFTVAIPPDRNGLGGNTRYSPGLPTLEMGSSAHK